MRVFEIVDPGFEFFVGGGNIGLGNLEDPPHVVGSHSQGRVSIVIMCDCKAWPSALLYSLTLRPF